MRTALYARVSTAEQTCANQLEALREHAAHAGWQVVGEFVDQGISGGKDSRPALNQLMAAARRRQFDRVLVWRFDRFARSTSHLIRALDEFRALGIDFCSHSEALDTATPAGKVMFTVIAAMAEFERSLIRERTVAGLRRARAQGKRLGRRRVITDLTRLRQLLSSGLSYRAAARRLGVSEGAVRRVVRENPTLASLRAATRRRSARASDTASAA